MARKPPANQLGFSFGGDDEVAVQPASVAPPPPPPVYSTPFEHADLEPTVRSKMLAPYCQHKWIYHGDLQTCDGMCRITLKQWLTRR